MKKLLPSLIAVKRIQSQVPRDRFPAEDLESAAQLSLAASGLINPIILRRTSLQSYEVVDGHFEYYIAVRAREIDPRKGETIGAFILEPDNSEAILEQVKALRQEGKKVNIPPVVPPEHSMETVTEMAVTEEIKQIKCLVKNLETSFQEKVEFLTQKIETTSVEQNILVGIEKMFDLKLEALRNEVKTGSESKAATSKISYRNMTVSELKALAKKQGLSGYSRMKKADLIAAIKNQSPE
ncbi:MAG: Rho termination factor N-terminal domain-containing protein [Hormoscilla sp. GUM202]|nr:Rho termination factor N-terminal domain-containing protein [Hormoscilla sp. GUM202]